MDIEVVHDQVDRFRIWVPGPANAQLATRAEAMSLLRGRAEAAPAGDDSPDGISTQHRSAPANE